MTDTDVTARPTWYTSSYLESQIGSVCLSHGWKVHNHRDWFIGHAAGATFVPPEAWTVLAADLLDDNATWLVKIRESGAKLYIYQGKLRVTTYGASFEAAQAIMALIAELLPAAEAPSDGIRLSFWSLTAHGPVEVERQLSASSWDSIQQNYPEATQGALDQLMQRTAGNDAAGKLILWHGPPGTGKTWAIRALGLEWAKWATLHYITDPEDFFTSSAAYMMKVILDEESGLPPELRESGDPNKSKVLILEDAGELLATDAKAQTGQGLSRLLNLCDGLIGQGLRLFVLITTNENLESLHPAVTRPGRCIANIEFGEFPHEESRDWLLAHGVPYEDIAYRNTGRTLAKLYEEIAEHEQISARRTERKVGFQIVR